MTVIDHLRVDYPSVVSGWVNDTANDQEFKDWVETPGQPLPDRVAINNPDSETTRWEWDADLTQGEYDLFMLTIKSAKSGIDMTDYAAMADDIAYLRATMLDTGKPEFERRTSRVILNMLRD